jgi:hypothetical protein
MDKKRKKPAMIMNNRTGFLLTFFPGCANKFLNSGLSNFYPE